MAENKPLSDSARPVFITGASRGIGAATAREFAKHSHPVALCARNKDAIEKLAQEIDAAGGKAVAVPCDVGDPAQVESAIASAPGPPVRVSVVGATNETCTPCPADPTTSNIPAFGSDLDTSRVVEDAGATMSPKLSALTPRTDTPCTIRAVTWIVAFALVPSP